MPLTEKAQYHLDRAMTLAGENGSQIFGFIIAANEQEDVGELGRFSSHPMTEDKFVEAVSSAASLMLTEVAQA